MCYFKEQLPGVGFSVTDLRKGQDLCHLKDKHMLLKSMLRALCQKFLFLRKNLEKCKTGGVEKRRGANWREEGKNGVGGNYPLQFFIPIRESVLGQVEPCLFEWAFCLGEEASSSICIMSLTYFSHWPKVWGVVDFLCSRIQALAAFTKCHTKEWQYFHLESKPRCNRQVLV